MRGHRLGCALLVVLVGCTVEVAPYTPDPWQEPPPPTPRPPWGVPVSGGTLAISPDGHDAVVADPDRDRILIVDLVARSVGATLDLDPGDEPGRVVWDGSGRAHVALRRGGAIVTVAEGAVTARRPVCPEPRGIAWDVATDLLHVACSGGELVSLPAAGGDPVRLLRLERDLRDVIVRKDDLLVTRFRSAEVLRVDAKGTILERLQPPLVPRTITDPFGSVSNVFVDAPASVAWRAVVAPDGTVVMTHQRRVEQPLSIQPGGYGTNPCMPTVEVASTAFPPSAPPVAGRSLQVLGVAVDVAASPDGQLVAFASAGTPGVAIFSSTVLAGGEIGPCDPPSPDDPPEELVEMSIALNSIPTSVAFTPSLPSTLVVLLPEEPALLFVNPSTGATGARIDLGGGFQRDDARTIFHRVTISGLACASCHPEGRDDGQVWRFAEIGSRRTQSIAGGILSRAPYHWTGDMPDLDTLLDNVLVNRMGGFPISDFEVSEMGVWLDRIPAPAPSAAADPEAVARGEALFSSEEIGCNKCHQGERYTTNELVDVGTGGIVKVPSLLGVAARAPYLHDGRAPTLRDRFGPLGGGDEHGVTSGLSEAQISDLVAYLESL